MADRQFLDPASPLNQELEWETVINDRSLPVSYTTVKYQHATDREPSWDLDYATKSHSRRRALNTSGSEEGLGSPVSKRKELDTFSDSEIPFMDVLQGISGVVELDSLSYVYEA